MSKEVEVVALPSCAFCENRARYDFRVKNGGWAYGCVTHFKEYRACDELGTGKGQHLVLPHESRMEKERDDTQEVGGMRESDARAILTELLGNDVDAIESELEDWGFGS